MIVPVLHDGLEFAVVVVQLARVSGGVVEGVVDIALGRVRSKTSQALPVDRLYNILIRLRFVRLVIF